jgi:DNA-binding transcriptional regulator YiaG
VEIQARKLTIQQLAAIRAAAADVPIDPDFSGKHPMAARHRNALLVGKPTGEAIREFRLMLQLTQESFAAGLGISMSTLRNWEQGVRHPEGPAVALLRLVARHPRLLLHELVPAAYVG